MKILISQIDWDCEDDAERAKLPPVVVLDVGDHLLTHIAGELSEQTGWCVHDFRAVLLDAEYFAPDAEVEDVGDGWTGIAVEST